MLPQLGRLVTVQVTGAVPVPRNWNEYADPTTPPVMGEVVVIAGATPGEAMVIEKFFGPSAPALFVAVTAITVVPAESGVPSMIPVVGWSVAQGSGPVAVQVIGAVPVALNVYV
jgi:hypothetical protein